MMDTNVDGKGQRIQVMLYAKANWKGILPRAVCPESGHARFGAPRGA
jgi:hypothetical protein